MPDGGIMADQFIDPARIYIRNIAKRGFDVSAVRVRPNTSARVTKLSQHEADRGEF
jgi:hypothetical protein